MGDYVYFFGTDKKKKKFYRCFCMSLHLYRCAVSHRLAMLGFTRRETCNVTRIICIILVKNWKLKHWVIVWKKMQCRTTTTNKCTEFEVHSFMYFGLLSLTGLHRFRSTVSQYWLTCVLTKMFLFFPDGRKLKKEEKDRLFWFFVQEWSTIVSLTVLNILVFHHHVGCPHTVHQ